MAKLRLADVNRERYTAGRSVLLFLTDRCPVGCAHCSVDSRRDSPTITDYPLFGELLAGICAEPEVVLVGISGGEPFIERRGLSMAVAEIANAGKDIAVFTSGVWAVSGSPPRWLHEVLQKVSCVFLSSDSFHAESVSGQRFIRAARSIVGAGTPVVVQVLDIPEQVAAAKELLTAAIGEDWPAQADISLIAPLPYGRGEGVFGLQPLRAAASLGSCAVLASPVVRYDGQAIACCNESVIMGNGPKRLRATCRTAAELSATLAELRRDPLLRVVAGPGMEALVSHPAYASLQDGAYRGICDLCWRAQDQTPAAVGASGDPLLNAMALLSPARPRDNH